MAIGMSDWRQKTKSFVVASYYSGITTKEFLCIYSDRAYIRTCTFNQMRPLCKSYSAYSGLSLYIFDLPMPLRDCDAEHIVCFITFVLAYRSQYILVLEQIDG